MSPSLKALPHFPLHSTETWSYRLLYVSQACRFKSDLKTENLTYKPWSDSKRIKPMDPIISKGTMFVSPKLGYISRSEFFYILIRVEVDIFLNSIEIFIKEARISQNFSMKLSHSISYFTEMAQHSELEAIYFSRVNLLDSNDDLLEFEHLELPKNPLMKSNSSRKRSRDSYPQFLAGIKPGDTSESFIYV